MDLIVGAALIGLGMLGLAILIGKFIRWGDGR